MKEHIVLAVDGLNEHGEEETVYLRRIAGVWCWMWQPPKFGSEGIPDVIPEDYKEWLMTPTEPYKVKVTFVPESIIVERI